MRAARQIIPESGATGKRDILLVLLFIVVVIAVAGSCGCIKVVQRSIATEQQGSGETAGMVVNSTTAIPAGTQPEQTVQLGNRVIKAPSPATTPSSPDTASSSPATGIVSEATPILTPDPYPDQHASRINQTNASLRLTREPEFRKTYTLGANATGLIVNVTRGPLAIAFEIDPLYDCIDDPDSCRGEGSPVSANSGETGEESLTSVGRPYFIITVRDNETGEIVAQDGYGREYSSATSNRTVTVYGQGQYHLTLEGGYLDVRLSITTGSSPYTTDMTDSSGTAEGSLSQAEYERFIRRMQGG